MKSKLAVLGLGIVLATPAMVSYAQVMVGGAPMYATKDIVDKAVNSKDHTAW